MDVKDSSVKISETRVFNISLCEDNLLSDTAVSRVRSLRGEIEGVSETRDNPSHNSFGRYLQIVMTYLTKL